jgi:serine/threonine-protein kinase RsbW
MPTQDPHDPLLLDSRLSELSRAQQWAEELAGRLGLNQKTRYAIRLCLEEALANIILHGYRSEAGHPIVIRSWLSGQSLFLAIDDQAPAFDPAQTPQQTAASDPATLESLEPGGYGIRLLRHFAESLAYEQLPNGNRITMSFPGRSA